jgi:tRNA A-37 threonylcarbamoyl transferase component Bud32
MSSSGPTWLFGFAFLLFVLLFGGGLVAAVVLIVRAVMRSRRAPVGRAFGAAAPPGSGPAVNRPDTPHRLKAERRTGAPGRCPACGTQLPTDSPEGLCPGCLLRCAVNSPVPAPAANGAASPRAPFVPPTPAELAPHFPGLEILELIGVGGMGAVYKARQRKLDRLVALKILPEEWGRDPAFAERFGREARALARLSHPHIVHVHDFGEAGGHFFLLMEYVDGVNLRQLLMTGPLQPQMALQVVPQVCDALQYAHEEGVVHRDIKPENILLDRRGRVKIADFGLAKLVGPAHVSFTLTGTHQVMGTLDYMAPEQRLRPQEVDHRADIYSLGVLFYEMLTGELPLGRFEPPSRRAGVDGRLDEVVFRALERDPERRYQHASDVRADVESVAGHAPARPAPAPPWRGPAAAVPEEVQLQVSGPAVGLVLAAAVGMLHWLGIGVECFSDFLSNRHPRGAEPAFLFWTAFLIVALFIGGLTAVILNGARRLRECSHFGAVMAGVLLAMLPWSAHVLVGLPVGIWCLVVLARPQVRAAFAANLRRRVGPAGPPLGGVRSFLGSLRSQFIARPAAAGAPPVGAANGGLDAGALRRVNGPSVGLMVTAAVAFTHWALLGAVLALSYLRHEGVDRHFPEMVFMGGLFLAVGLILLGLAALIFVGGLRLRHCDGEGLVLVAILLAILPWSLHCLIGVPVAVWCLWAMTRPEVHAAFAANYRLRRGRPAPAVEEAVRPPERAADAPPPHHLTTPPPHPTGPFRRRVRSFLHSLRSMFVSSPDLRGPTTADASGAAEGANAGPP